MSLHHWAVRSDHDGFMPTGYQFTILRGAGEPVGFVSVSVLHPQYTVREDSRMELGLPAWPTFRGSSALHFNDVVKGFSTTSSRLLSPSLFSAVRGTQPRDGGGFHCSVMSRAASAGTAFLSGIPLHHLDSYDVTMISKCSKETHGG